MKKILSVLLAVLCLSLSACGVKTAKKEKFTDYTFDYFDTVTTIVGFEENKEKFDLNCDIIKEKLGFYHKLFNIYNKYDGINNLAVINESKEPVTSDKEIIEMLKFCEEMFKQTNGKVNVAMGSVLSLWHNYRTAGLKDTENAQLPPMDKLLSASNHTDINNLIINETDNTVFIDDSDMSLDVGAIAKGYAVEQTALFMEQSGITGYILNVGGNVRIVGIRPDGEKWKIGIENPDTDNSDNPYAEYLLLDGMSLVTSGSYQRFYTVNGKNYHHIIDPETLMPAEYFASVSVLTKSSALADALSTALFTMSYEDGLKLIEKFSLTEAMWITPDGEKLYSSGFKSYCTD